MVINSTNFDSHFRSLLWDLSVIVVLHFVRLFVTVSFASSTSNGSEAVENSTPPARRAEPFTRIDARDGSSWAARS